MKKLLLIMILLNIAVSGFAADTTEKRQAYNAMIESQKLHNDVCRRVSDNFRRDSRFAGYIRSTCLLYQSDRQRLVDSVFPISNNIEDETYKDQYPVLMSNFVIDMNKREIEKYKTIVNEYCKYNIYKYTKKDPMTCSQERINSLFAP